jgi:hypothetical protein
LESKLDDFPIGKTSSELQKYSSRIDFNGLLTCARCIICGSYDLERIGQTSNMKRLNEPIGYLNKSIISFKKAKYIGYD